MASEASDFRIPDGGLLPAERVRRVERDAPSGDSPRRNFNAPHSEQQSPHRDTRDEELPRDIVTLSDLFAAGTALVAPPRPKPISAEAPAERHIDIKV